MTDIYPSHTKGAAAEHLGAAALILDGWWVSSVGGHHCPFDIVAVRHKQRLRVVLLDVKTRPLRGGLRSRTMLQRALGVKILYVDLDSGGVSLSGAKAATGDRAQPLGGD